MSAPIELLQQVPLFKGLDEKYLKNLSAEFTERRFSEGQELTAEGSGGAGFFVIESGTAKVTVDGEDRRTLGPGDFYGEIALIDGGTRTATITALERRRRARPHQVAVQAAHRDARRDRLAAARGDGVAAPESSTSTEPRLVRATIWGCRGSLATPGERTVRYGGNTSSVELRPASGRLVVLDAGTGIRPLGLSLREVPERIDLLLTHLHLDHVEGLGFFAPLFAPGLLDHDLGPAAGGLVARRADRGLPVAAVLPAPLRRAAVEDRVRRARRGDVAARRADHHLRRA